MIRGGNGMTPLCAIVRSSNHASAGGGVQTAPNRFKFDAANADTDA